MPDIEVILTLLPKMLRWRVEVSYATVVWEDDAGLRHVFGDQLVPEVIGMSDDHSKMSPFRRAWAGEEVTGGRAELGLELQPLLQSLGANIFWLRPIAGLDGRTMSC